MMGGMIILAIVSGLALGGVIVLNERVKDLERITDQCKEKP